MPFIFLISARISGPARKLAVALTYLIHFLVNKMIFQNRIVHAITKLSAFVKKVSFY